MRKANPTIDYTNKDYEAFRNMMIQELGVVLPTYTDTSQTDAGIVIIELLSKGLDILSYYQDVIANETMLSTANQRSSVLKWCSMLGYIPKTATASEFEQVFVLSSLQTTPTVIPRGTRVKTLETVNESSIYFETTKDLTIPINQLGNETLGVGVYKYTVPVIQGTTVSSEIVGSSRGTVNQNFKLKYSPVLENSVGVLVNEGFGYEEWTRVTNFMDSLASDKHFVLMLNEYNETSIIFGDGVLGKIPNVFQNGIISDYRVGGGITGNVSANKITLLDSNIGLVSETFNPYSASVKASDKETLAEIKVNAPAYPRTKWGAITLDDFSDLAKMYFPQVKYSIAKHDPSNIDGVILYVVLQEGQVATLEFKTELLEFFQERRVIGSILSMGDPIFTPVNITASLIVHNRFSRLTVKTAIEEYLTDYFKRGNYDFFTDLSITELESNIMINIEGVKSFRISLPVNTVVTAQREGIMTLGSLSISVIGGVE